MRRLFPAVALLASLVVAVPVASADDEIVVLRPTDHSAATETAQRERALGFEAEHTYDHAIDGFSADLSDVQVAKLRQDPEVAMVVPDRPVHASSVVSAVAEATVPPGVHRVTETLPGTVREAADGAVAVLDTGVDLAHPDLNAVAGTNCITPGAAPQDDNGHGTHVSGIIGARNDSQGVTGVAPGTKIVAVKVLDSNGDGTTSSILCGINWVLAHAADQGITVANFSLGGYGPDSTCRSDPEHAAFCSLSRAGITPVVAAGNEGLDIGANASKSIPAAYPEVLTVSAMNDTDGEPGGAGPADIRCGTGTADDAAAAFSDYATRSVDEAHLVAAPGVCVRSTWPGNRYRYMSGTSMASPHVAGLVALCDGEGGADGPCAGLSTPQVIARMRSASSWSPFTAISGRLPGALALLSDPNTPTPQVAATPPDDGAGTATPPAPAPAPAGAAPASGGVIVLPPAPVAAPARPVSSRRPSIRLVTPRLDTLRRRGLTLKLTCPDDCSGVLKLALTRSLARRLKLSSTTLAIAYPDGAGTVRLRLGSRARTAVARLTSLKVSFVAEIDLADRTLKSSKALTIRR